MFKRLLSKLRSVKIVGIYGNPTNSPSTDIEKMVNQLSVDGSSIGDERLVDKFGQVKVEGKAYHVSWCFHPNHDF